MSMATSIFPTIRTTAVPAGLTQAVMSPRGAIVIAQDGPPDLEIVRLGRSWSARIPLANHFSTVAAQPTTRAEMVIGNSALVGSNTCIVIDYIEFLCDTTQAAATQGCLVAQLVPNLNAVVALPADNAAVLRNSRNAKAQYQGVAKIAIANTAFAIADRWDTLDYFGGAASASIGFGGKSRCLYIVQPNSVFCANVVVGTAAATSATMGIGWHEVEIVNA